jgi:hypothetical protein
MFVLGSSASWATAMIVLSPVQGVFHGRITSRVLEYFSRDDRMRPLVGIAVPTGRRSPRRFASARAAAKSAMFWSASGLWRFGSMRVMRRRVRFQCLPTTTAGHGGIQRERG